MICHRCQGLMTEEELRDWASGKGFDRSSAFRCISCGEIIDPVILKNRDWRVMEADRGKRRPRFGARVAGL